MDEGNQDTGSSDTLTGRTGWRDSRGTQLLVTGLAVVGALCVLPIAAGILAVLVKVAIGLIAAAIGLVCGLASLVIGLVFGALGLLVGLLGAVAGFLVSPPGLLIIAIVLYFKLRD